MNIEEYKSQLSLLLGTLSEEEREDAISFYLEQIADRIDEGATEEDAVASIPSPGEAAQTIIAEAPAREPLVSFSVVTDASGDEAANEDEGFFKRVKSRKLKPLEWVALIVTSPLWISLLAAVLGLAVGVAAVLLSLYICAWVLVACIWIVGGAFVLAAPCALLFIVWGFQVGNISYALVNLGYALMTFGGGVWVLKAAYKVTRGFVSWQKRNISVRFSKSKSAEDIGDDVDSVSEHSGVKSANLNDDAEEQTVANITDSNKPYAFFFRVCWIMVLAGLALVLAGFIASGMDWHVFSSSYFKDGNVYLGNAHVDDPSKLLFFPTFFLSI